MPETTERPAPDDELMKRTAAGDRGAFAALYERHSATVYRFARLMTGSSTAADDVVQDVFLVVMRDASRFDSSRASLSSYLYGIARHHTRRRLLRQRRFVALDAGKATHEESAIEGVKAQGTRTTTTIPAGAIGNVLPIDIVSERWFSPQLQMPVLITRNDPRSGETIYRLINIVRTEPADALFTIPAGYDIRDGKLAFRVLEMIEGGKKKK